MVRAELQGCAAFTEVTRGRWVLGTSSGYPAAALHSAKELDYLTRLHKDTRRLWSYASGRSAKGAASGAFTTENSVPPSTATRAGK
jgi:hypothetical protein